MDFGVFSHTATYQKSQCYIMISFFLISFTQFFGVSRHSAAYEKSLFSMIFCFFLNYCSVWILAYSRVQLTI